MAGLAHGVDADTLVVLARGPLTLGQQQFAWFQVTFTSTRPRIVPEQAEHTNATPFPVELQVPAVDKTPVLAKNRFS
ncbi:hypothetical protein PBR20603_03836 [Pandoraea bronchicola]|uniref:Uncharacterized protein n=1 Tax=Pandoraea bronchicola TaxID=2508287 RepID=A0A5E5BZS5_9BURK|nr:hypothetical protein PBR20603_03836 [Pandoraea bronchicola]